MSHEIEVKLIKCVKKQFLLKKKKKRFITGLLNYF